MTSTTQEKAPECGKRYMQKISTGKKKQFVCNLPPGHEGAHRRARKEGVPAETILKKSTFLQTWKQEGIDVADAHLREMKRSEMQQELDGHVKEAYEEWKRLPLRNGKRPDAWDDIPKQSYELSSKAEAAAVKKLLVKAGTFLKIRVRTSLPHVLENGNVVLYWAAQDKPPEAEDKPETKPEDAEAKKDEPEEDTSTDEDTDEDTNEEDTDEAQAGDDEAGEEEAGQETEPASV